MSQNITKVIIGIFALIFVAALFDSCAKQKRYSQVQRIQPSNTAKPTYADTTVIPTAQLVAAAEDFDLRVLEKLLKESTSPEDFEKRLNAENPRIHNLDLDENEVVDFINVTEFGSGNNRGLSLTVELAPEGGEKQIQEVATIMIEKTGANDGTYEVKGNEALYGQNHVYRSGFGVTDFLLMGMLFNNFNRPPYYSGYGYNNYPSYYGRHRTYYHDDYRRGIAPMVGSSTVKPVASSDLSSKMTSPNAGKSAANVRAPLKSPTASQQSFQSRNPSKQVRSGGFGSGSTTTRSTTTTTTTRPSQPSVRSSSSSRSGSRSGGGGGK